ncbi:MAG: envelope stress response membrane protein PspB [Novosphingobium sp.]|nr:envelope stress response membrane protein PspB [Novosphingobium sp.]
MDEASSVLIVGICVIGLPWLIMHYITRWKTAPTLTDDDEELLDDLYQLARRLEDRLETVERLVAADNPDFRPQLPPARTVPEPNEALYRRGTTQ